MLPTLCLHTTKPTSSNCEGIRLHSGVSHQCCQKPMCTLDHFILFSLVGDCLAKARDFTSVGKAGTRRYTDRSEKGQLHSKPDLRNLENRHLETNPFRMHLVSSPLWGFDSFFVSPLFGCWNLVIIARCCALLGTSGCMFLFFLINNHTFTADHLECVKCPRNLLVFGFAMSPFSIRHQCHQQVGCGGVHQPWRSSRGRVAAILKISKFGRFSNFAPICKFAAYHFQVSPWRCTPWN